MYDNNNNNNNNNENYRKGSKHTYVCVYVIGRMLTYSFIYIYLYVKLTGYNSFEHRRDYWSIFYLLSNIVMDYTLGILIYTNSITLSHLYNNGFF